MPIRTTIKAKPLDKVRKTETYEIQGNKICSEKDPGLTFGKRK
jgi:hypothetical protein